MTLITSENPLLIPPSLSVIIGLNESIFVQQVHYWLERSSNEIDGYKWVYNTISQWRIQFPFWSESTISRIIKSLKSSGLLITGRLSPDLRDNTNFYRIDYDALAVLLEKHSVSLCFVDTVNLTGCKESDCVGAGSQVAVVQDVNLTDRKESGCLVLHTENTTKNTTKNKPKNPPPAKRGGGDETAFQTLCKQTWFSYASSYKDRYGVMPVRNAKVNSQVKQLAQRIGSEAPDVAGFYLTVNDAFIVRGTHDLGLLVSRAESMRTQWVTGKVMTVNKSRQLDQTATNASAAEESIRLLRSKRRNND